MNGERQENLPIKVNGKGQNKEVNKDLEAREEIANSRSPLEGRKRKKRQCGYEAGEREEGEGVGGEEDEGEIKNGDNGVSERGGSGKAVKVKGGGKKGGQGKEKGGVGEKRGGNGEGEKIERNQGRGEEWKSHKSAGKREKGRHTTKKGIGTWLFMMPMVRLFMMLLMIPSGINASVVISPPHGYTTFENNASTFTFNCSGNGTSLLWIVDGQSAGSSYVLNKGIRYTPFIASPDGLTVSSQFIVPTTKANNNITVICIVLDTSFNFKSSNPVKLFLQGILAIPLEFTMDFSNSTVSLSWVAPDSLHVSTPPTISHYVLSNNLTNGTKIFNNPTTCNPLASCNYSLDLRDPFFTTDGNTTMLDYNGAVEFTLLAVNGAGNGNAATFTYIMPRSIPTDVPNQTVPAAENTSSTPASNNTTSAVYLYGIVIVASVCAVLGTMIVVVLVIVIAVVCCFKKKLKWTPNYIDNETAINATNSSQMTVLQGPLVV
ncbi:hypothetical protein EMCRGX_G030367 [Ephydatia muelleri]